MAAACLVDGERDGWKEKGVIGWEALVMEMGVQVVVDGLAGGVKGVVGRKEERNYLKPVGCE